MWHSIKWGGRDYYPPTNSDLLNTQKTKLETLKHQQGYLKQEWNKFVTEQKRLTELRANLLAEEKQLQEQEKACEKEIARLTPIVKKEAEARRKKRQQEEEERQKRLRDEQKKAKEEAEKRKAEREALSERLKQVEQSYPDDKYNPED